MSIADVLFAKGRDVVKVATTQTVKKVVRTMAEHHIGAVIVEDEFRHWVGLFTEGNLLRAIAEHGPDALNARVDEFMNARLISCRLSHSVETVMAAMTQAKIQHLPVVEAGQIVGMVSIGDLVQQRLDEQELAVHPVLTELRFYD